MPFELAEDTIYVFLTYSRTSVGALMTTEPDGPRDKVTKTDEEWQQQLTPEQYKITRCSGTERAFTGANWDEKATGTYSCICCGNALFRSETKFDSGTGWPSFYAPVDVQAIEEHDDRGFFSRRTEIRCSTCDAHLGHVFPDGPKPTGLRYCMNGNAMTLTKDA